MRAYAGLVLLLSGGVLALVAERKALSKDTEGSLPAIKQPVLFDTPEADMDVHEGGAWRTVMRTPPSPVVCSTVSQTSG